MVLADRLHKMPSEIRDMDIHDFMAFSAFTRIEARRDQEVNGK